MCGPTDSCFWRAVISRYLQTLNAFPRREAFDLPAAKSSGSGAAYPLWSKFDSAPDEKVALVAEGKSFTYGVLREYLSKPDASEGGVTYLKHDRSAQSIIDILSACGKPEFRLVFPHIRLTIAQRAMGLVVPLAETSGSTGEPKPMLIGQAGIEHLLPDWQSRLGISNQSVHLSLTSTI